MIFAASAAAQSTVLYDGNLPPTATGLTYSALPPATYYTYGGLQTTLDTNANAAIFAGFGTNAIPLDRLSGYTLRIDAQLLSESHSNVDRAGFSILVLSSDLRGIELGFHTNEIFAQGDSPLFVRGESAPFDSSTALTRYDLVVLGNSYTLKANGIATLTGALRDYTAFAGPIDPYETPNSIFFGDDTTSASGATKFTYVSVSVPEPTTLATIAAGMVAVVARRRR